MTEHIGEWHTLTVNDPADTDDVMELEHPESCPRRKGDEDDFFTGTHACSLGDEVSNCGYENFEAPDGGTLTPGAYRARFRAWSTYSYYYGSEEWDSCVEVEHQERVAMA